MPCRMDRAQRVPEIPEWEELKVLANLAPRVCGSGQLLTVSAPPFQLGEIGIIIVQPLRRVVASGETMPVSMQHAVWCIVHAQ